MTTGTLVCCILEGKGDSESQAGMCGWFCGWGIGVGIHVVDEEYVILLTGVVWGVDTCIGKASEVSKL